MQAVMLRYIKFRQPEPKKRLLTAEEKKENKHVYEKLENRIPMAGHRIRGG